MDLSHLSPEQRHYVAQRQLQIRWWNRLGWIFFAVLAAALVWLARMHPLYLNPLRLLEKLRLGQVSDIEIARLAAFGNLAFLGCAALFLGLILLTYVAMWTENRTIRMLLTPPKPSSTPQSEANDESHA